MSQLVEQYRRQNHLAFSQLETIIQELGKLTVLLHEECHIALSDMQVSPQHQVLSYDLYTVLQALR